MKPLLRWEEAHIVAIEAWVDAHPHSLDLDNLFTKDNIGKFLQPPSQLDVHGQELVPMSTVSQPPLWGIVITSMVRDERSRHAMDARGKGNEKVVKGEKKKKIIYHGGSPFEASRKRALLAGEENLASVPILPTIAPPKGRELQFFKASPRALMGILDSVVVDSPQMLMESVTPQ